MKARRFTLLLLAALMCILILPSTALAASGPVPIDASHFPDQYFRGYISNNFDLDKNGSLSPEEISRVDQIVTDDIMYDVESLQGIEYFTELESLFAGGLQKVQSLDLTKNTNLWRVHLGSCNSLTDINIKGLTKLNELHCEWCENLRQLDITGCTILEGIVNDNSRQPGGRGSGTVLYPGFGKGEFVTTGWVDLYFNGKNHHYGLPITWEFFPDEFLRDQLRSSVEGFDTNEDWCLSDDEIAQIKRISVDPNVSSIEGIEYFTELESIGITAYHLKEADLSKNKKLKEVSVDEERAFDDYTYFEKLNISGCTELTSLYAYSTHLKEIDLTTNKLLEYILLYDVPGLKIDIRGNDRLINTIVNNEPSIRDDIDQVNYHSRTEGVQSFNFSKTAELIFDKPQNPITAYDETINFNLKKQQFTLSASAKDNAKLSFKSANSKYISIDKSTGTVTISPAYVGKATLTITAGETSRFAETTKQVTVKVLPAAPKLKSVKNTGKGKMTVKWTKTKSTKSNGYIIAYSTSKDFSKGTKTVKVKGVKKVSKVISKLKKGKTYYVSIKTYLKDGAAVYESPWTAVKKVKIKK